MAKIKCADCGEKFNPDEGGWYGNISEKYICDGCWESESEHASTIVRYAPDGKEVVRYGDHSAITDEGDEPPEWFWHYFGGRKWHSTDAWRGYYDTEWKNGFVRIADGWVTGWVDDTVSHKQPAIDFNEYIQKEYATLPCPVYWLFEQTSNVFSTASEIFLDKADKPKFVKWLKANGFDEQTIKESFD